MDSRNNLSIPTQIEATYRTESRRAFATLVRLLGDFDLAEECLSEAFTIAVEKWSVEGVPANPRAWLVSTARFKGIDAIRRRARHETIAEELARQRLPAPTEPTDRDDEIADDQLRLIFTCCHPALSKEVQVALTLREVCGLTTDEIACAFLLPSATLAQRLVRGKAKIREAKIPYVIPNREDMHDRVESVLAVIYLVFNEGYHASFGDTMLRPDLSMEAIRLGRLLFQMLPDSEVAGLLALMLFHESRYDVRVDAEGEIVLLEDQDRSLWNHEMIAEAGEMLAFAMNTGEIGVYGIQAAIAQTHSQSSSSENTDWNRIIDWYDVLLRTSPSPVIELNRAVAVSMRDGPERGLELIEELICSKELANYHLAHAAKAELLRRANKPQEAIAAFRAALLLAQQGPERRFLERRIQELSR